MEEQKRPDSVDGTKNQAAFVRLLVSLVILGAALILRAFYPDQTRDFLQKAVAGGMDYTAILGDVGDGLRAFVLGVPHPDEHKEAEVAGEEEQAIGFEQGQTFDPENEPPPDGVYGQGGFDPPILWADARLLLSQFDGEDDTLPLPFGMQKPDKVDYTVYELPFETVTPADGVLTSSFGYRIHPIYGDWRFHYGIDIANKTGTPIVAFADGTVAATGKSDGYGNYLIIEHSDGYVSLYAHCKTVDVKAGQEVTRGQEVAAVGSTGLTTGPHLHFELRRGDAFLNPAPYVDV
ncbi:MAG: M23 family metallopeptidase [Oscillospiraceae bacterium]|jgi:murein DD-endopeptidase MepM/ murein hydrolase activator NlpD|nr:M23 family metallopeptidase [Oscillospiraceae bacterium]